MSLILYSAGFLTGRISSREDVSGMDDISNPANSWLSPVLQERYLNDSQFEGMRVVKAAAVSWDRDRHLLFAGLKASYVIRRKPTSHWRRLDIDGCSTTQPSLQPTALFLGQVLLRT
jgi:hypothetical protein